MDSQPVSKLAINSIRPFSECIGTRSLNLEDNRLVEYSRSQATEYASVIFK